MLIISLQRCNLQTKTQKLANNKKFVSIMNCVYYSALKFYY